MKSKLSLSISLLLLIGSCLLHVNAKTSKSKELNSSLKIDTIKKLSKKLQTYAYPKVGKKMISLLSKSLKKTLGLYI